MNNPFGRPGPIAPAGRGKRVFFGYKLETTFPRAEAYLGRNVTDRLQELLSPQTSLYREYPEDSYELQWHNTGEADYCADIWDMSGKRPHMATTVFVDNAEDLWQQPEAVVAKIRKALYQAEHLRVLEKRVTIH